MQVQRIQNNNYNTNFGAGRITLDKISSKELLQYDSIKRIAEENKLDLDIIKGRETKYLPKSDLYIAVAKQDYNETQSLIGVGCTMAEKNVKAEEASATVYDAVVKALEKLAQNIQKRTGIKPDFIK